MLNNRNSTVCRAPKTKPLAITRGHLLAYLDSNQDKQNQNLSYYHYTIGQFISSLACHCAFKPAPALKPAPRLQKGLQK